jgi:peroxiredoxin
MVAVSPNTVEQADSMRSQHGINVFQLADPDLEVIDLYGLRHERAMAGDMKDERGMFRPIAIPTTILIGADGVVRWIDQSTDYRVRSDAKRVLRAIKSLLK